MSIERRLDAEEAWWDDHVHQHDQIEPPECGNVISFCTEVLGWTPYPAQALVLKLMVGAGELLTAEDDSLLEAWQAGYASVDDHHFVGMSGTTPDVRDRLVDVVDRWGFRQAVLVLGRRAGKSQITATVILWTIWRLICLGNPQAHFGMPDRKAITAITFAADRDGVARTLFGDIRRLADGSEILSQFLATSDKYRLTLYTPQQINEGDPDDRRPGSLVIEAASAHAVAARGLSLIALAFDEAASSTAADRPTTAPKSCAPRLRR